MSFTHLTTLERSKLHQLRVIDKLPMLEIVRRLNRHKNVNVTRSSGTLTFPSVPSATGAGNPPTS